MLPGVASGGGARVVFSIQRLKAAEFDGEGPRMYSAPPRWDGREAEPDRGGRSLRSVTLVRVLSIYNFNMSEGEEAPPPIHLPLPLAVDVHPGHLDDVANLGKDGKMGGD